MEAIGTTLERLVLATEGGRRTAPLPPAIASSALANLPARLDDVTLAQAQAIAVAPLPAPETSGDQHVVKCIRVLLAALPKRNSDDVSGELLIKAYQRKLASYPKDQINYLSDKVLERCQWFPTIAECVEIMAGWQRDDEAIRTRNRAAAAVRREMEARYDDVMAHLAEGECSQDEIDALPARWKEIADTRGYLRRNEDGSYAARPPLKEAGR